ncbi:MAG: PadR family transcriptional regulator [Planctomycetota bacterium]|nr:PadR family transcriptional regulator [Planctomycetota bacterium]
MRTWVSQLRKGLVELSVMAALRDGEAYGYQILQRLTVTEELATTESAVYPILARLARDGLVKVRAAPSPTGPPRRYYRLTPEGKARLKEMSLYWKGIIAAVNNLLQEKTR